MLRLVVTYLGLGNNRKLRKITEEIEQCGAINSTIGTQQLYKEFEAYIFPKLETLLNKKIITPSDKLSNYPLISLFSSYNFTNLVLLLLESEKNPLLNYELRKAAGITAAKCGHHTLANLVHFSNVNTFFLNSHKRKHPSSKFVEVTAKKKKFQQTLPSEAQNQFKEFKLKI